MNIWKRRSILTEFGIVALCSYLLMTMGCVSWDPYKNVVFSHSPPSVIGKSMPIIVGIDVFEDIRPGDEKRKMTNLDGVDREVTVKFARYLEYCRVFSDIKLPYKKDEVDVVLKGEVKNFEWKGSDWSPTCLMPLITTLCLPFGVPIGRISAHTGIEISLENPQTGEIIASYFETEKTSNMFSIYTHQENVNSKGVELNHLLRNVTTKIIEQIFADRDKILQEVNP